ncbi:Lon protease, partial [Bifidobacterium longum]
MGGMPKMKETRRIHGKNTRSGAPGRVKRWLIGAEGWLSARSWRYLAGPLVAVLCVLVLIMPSAYVVQVPGPTQNVLGEVSGKQVIAVSGAKTYKDSGQLLLVTVNASGVPGYPVSNAQALVAWADSKSTVMPQEAVVPVGQTAEEYKQSSDKEMTSSQDSATAAAKKFLEEHGYDVSGMKVSMHVDDIGGPSAGMMYTLGLIDKVTGE